MCCWRLAANTGRKKVAKNRHLGTIAQLCRAISSQLRHISTIGKKTRSRTHHSMTVTAVRGGTLASQTVVLLWGVQYLTAWGGNSRPRLLKFNLFIARNCDPLMGAWSHGPTGSRRETPDQRIRRRSFPEAGIYYDKQWLLHENWIHLCATNKCRQPLSPPYYTRMRGSAIWSIRSQWDRRNFVPLFPYPSQTSALVWTPFQLYRYVHPQSRCAKFGLNRFSDYGSAHAWRMRLGVDLLLTYPSVHLSVSSSGLQVTV